jgi:amino acid transporter
MAEETKNAAWIGPLGIVFAIGSSAILGWLLILSLLFSIQDIDATLESGAPVTQIFLDTVGDRGAIALMIIAVGAMYFAGLFSLMSNSRMLYAFARDGGIPGGSFFCKVDKKSKVPVRTGKLI